MIIKDPQLKPKNSAPLRPGAPKAGVECTHCRLPVPTGLIVRVEGQLAEEQFCCNGCRCAYALICDSGLEDFYRMAEAPGGQSDRQKAANTLLEFESFDEESFHQKFVTETSAGTSQATLLLSGIHCTACVWLLEKLPSIVPGVVCSRVSWARRTITVQWIEDSVRLSDIATTLHRLGYSPSPVSQAGSVQIRESENRRQLIRIGVAAAAAGNNMIIAAALYFGMFAAMSAPIESLLRWASCVVGVASFLGPGRVFLASAWNAALTRTPHMDLPIALGLTAGTVTGLVNVIRGEGEIYFDSLSVLICVLLIGRWVQFRQQNKAANAVELLFRLTPSRAKRVGQDGRVESVDSESLSVGDRIVIHPGDVIPADSTITQGKTSVDESVLTGESNSVARGVGDKLFAGAKNVRSNVTAMVDSAGAKTRIRKVVDLVQDASAEKTEVVQLANRIGGWFVMAVTLLAGLTFCFWAWFDVGIAVDRAVALTIVACPCALAMATPLAIAVGLGALARRGVLVKSGDVLQSLSRPGMIWLDKTGTLTEGRMKVACWHGDEACLPVVAAIEELFSHPIATAIIAHGKQAVAAAQTDIDVVNASQLDGGVQAEVAVVGRAEPVRYLVGSRKFLERHGVAFAATWDKLEQEINDRLMSACWVAAGHHILAVIELGDSIRDDSIALVGRLKSEGWSVGVLSGDHEPVVRHVASQVGADLIYAGVSPERKLEVIRDSNDRFATTVMVGDGVNDSAALAAATVGIAVKNGAEASLAAAPVFLAQDGLSAIHELLVACRRVNKTIRNNFVASIAYNVLGVGLAMFGLISPLVAAVLMPVSSLTVITLSLTAAKREQNNATDQLVGEESV